MPVTFMHDTRRASGAAAQPPCLAHLPTWVHLSVGGGPAALSLICFCLLPAAVGPCVDRKVPGKYTCAQQRRFGKCSAAFMRGYCSRTCARCRPAGPVKPREQLSRPFALCFHLLTARSPACRHGCQPSGAHGTPAGRRLSCYMRAWASQSCCAKGAVCTC